MPRQVEGVDGALFRQILLVEDPDVDVAAEAVEQNDRGAFALADLEVLDRTPAHLYLLGFWAGGLLRRLLRVEVGLELLDVGVYVLVGDVGRGDDPEDAAHGDDVPLFGDPAPQDPGSRGLDGVVDLLALDLHDLVAGA